MFHTNTSPQAQKDIIRKFKEEYYKANNVLPECNVAVMCSCLKDSSKIKAQKTFVQNQKGVDPTNAIVGTPNYCEDKINELAELFEVNEIVIFEPSFDLEQKTETVTLLGERMLQAVSSQS